MLQISERGNVIFLFEQVNNVVFTKLEMITERFQRKRLWQVLFQIRGNILRRRGNGTGEGEKRNKCGKQRCLFGISGACICCCHQLFCCRYQFLMKTSLLFHTRLLFSPVTLKFHQEKCRCFSAWLSCVKEIFSQNIIFAFVYGVRFSVFGKSHCSLDHQQQPILPQNTRREKFLL